MDSVAVASPPSVAHLCVGAHGRRVDAETVGIVAPAGRGRAPIYVLIEPSDAEADPRAALDTIEIVEHELAASRSRSTTAALTHALQAANTALHAANARCLPRDQVRLGALCATIRNGTLYVAQVGGPHAWLYRDGRARPLRGGDEPARPKLGAGAWLEPELTSAQLRPGDRVLLVSGALLLTSTRLAHALRERSAERAAQALANLHEASGARGDLALIVLHAEGDAPAVRHPPAPVPDESGWDDDDELLPSSPRRAPRRSADRTPPGSDRARAADEEPEVAPRSPGRGGAGRDWLGPVRRAVAGHVGLPRRTPPVEDEADWPDEEFEVPLRRPAGRSSLGRADWDYPDRSGRLRGGAPRRAAPRGEWRPPSLDLARVLASWPVLAGIGVLVAVLSVGAVLFSNVLRERVATEDVSRQLTEAETKEREAALTVDPGVKRQLLIDARRLAEPAAKNPREAQRVNGLINRVADQLDQLEGLVRLVGAIELLGVDALGKGNPIAQFTVGGNFLFALDGNGSAVHGYQVNAAGTEVRPLQRSPLFARGDKIGPSSLGQLAAITWMPLGGQRAFNALLCLDAAGLLLQYDPENGQSSLSTLGAGWGKIRATASYNGTFYVLDGQTRQLLRYPPSGQGFSSQPTSYFGPDSGIDFTAVADLAIDGDIYLLFGDGRVQKYAAGKPVPFAGAAPNTPVGAASRLYTTAATRSVYVADVGNRRVVQFSKAGEYERQFHYNGPQDIFKSVQALQVDELRGKLYLLNEGRIFVVDLPLA